MDKTLLSWIEIDSAAIKNNVAHLSTLAGEKVGMAAAVKSNAYGHGLSELVRILLETDVAYIAVHNTNEAETARAVGWDRHIMLVGGIAPGDLESVIHLDLEPTVFEPSFLKPLGKICRKSSMTARIHLKLETGTHRQGLLENELSSIAASLKDWPELSVAGVSTHFANIEDTTDHTYARDQLKEFTRLVGKLRRLGVRPRMRHTACSAALLLFPDTYFEMVRPGISLYGYWPSKETYVSYRLGGGENSILRPALTFRSRITQIKTVPPDSFIGYGCTYRTSSRSRIAILPVGYADGIDRRLSNLGYVLVHGRRAPIRGRVCMNLIMADITDIKGVRLYDAATIIGRDGSEAITADTHAGWCRTINYEILARLSPLMPRIII